MATQEHDQWRYLIIWEFGVRPGMEGRFEEGYGPRGDWAQFFSRSEGYVKTELNHDLKDSRRYVTLDFWVSREAYENFRQQHASEYAALDQKFEELTEKELEIGKFERIPERSELGEC
jgi:heme-degrading monooxygenase HmoA